MRTSDPESMLERWRRRQTTDGDVFPVAPGATAVLDPDLAAQAAIHNFAEQNVPDPLGDLLAGRSGPVSWRRVRAAWTPRLHALCAPQPVAALHDTMRSLLTARAGTPTDLLALSHEVCTFSLLPTVVDGLAPAAAARVRRDARTMYTALSHVGPVPPARREAVRTVWRQLVIGRDLRAELLGRARGRRPRRPDLTDPLVDLLPELGMGRSVDAIAALLTAIAGPPGAAAACLYHVLRQHPHWAQRVGAELAPLTPSHLHNPAAAPLTARVIRETLRMWSPPLVLARDVRVPIELPGLTLQPGERYMLSPYLMHRDPKRWSSPDEFDPDRWLPGAPGGPASGSHYVPFGFAPKACVGAGLATVQLLLLCRLLTVEFRTEFTAAPAGVTLAAVAVPGGLHGVVHAVHPTPGIPRPGERPGGVEDDGEGGSRG